MLKVKYEPEYLGKMRDENGELKKIYADMSNLDSFEYEKFTVKFRENAQQGVSYLKSNGVIVNLK